MMLDAGEGKESRYFDQQGRLDRILLDLRLDIGAWNGMLADLFMGRREAPNMSIDDLRLQAVESLNAKWPYTLHQFQIAGRMIDTNIEVSNDNRMLGIKKDDITVADMFQSNGFGILSTDDMTPPKVCMTFVTGNMQVFLDGAQTNIVRLVMLIHQK